MRRLALSGRGTPKIVTQILSRAIQISLLCYVLLIGYGAFITQPEVVEDTRISENAFLAGLVRDRCDQAAALRAHARKLHGAFKNDTGEAYVEEQLENMGLEVGKQAYALKTPYRVPHDAGTNIYGIFRTERNAPVEAILIVVPLDPAKMEGVALALATTECLKAKVYWARDVIVLFAQPSTIAVEAWLAAYHGYEVPAIATSPLGLRSGEIIGVYIFDVAGSSFTGLNLRLNGVNGRLPNLDLANVVGRMIRHVTRVKVNGLVGDGGSMPALALSLVKSIYDQTFREAEGLQSVFGAYGISAVTIEPERASQGHLPLVGLISVMELCVRGVNNVLEKLHQSYFLYYLVAPRKFLSVAYYMPFAGAFILPCVLLGLREYFRRTTLAVPRSLVAAHLAGLCVYMATMTALANARVIEFLLHVEQPDLVLGALLAAPLLIPSLVVSFVPIRSPDEAVATRFLLFVEAALVIGALSLISISPSLVIGAVLNVVLLGVAVFATGGFVRQLAALTVHPLVLLFAGQFALALLTGAQVPSLESAVIDTRVGLVTAFHNHVVHSAGLYPLLVVILTPMAAVVLAIAGFPSWMLPPPKLQDEVKEKAS